MPPAKMNIKSGIRRKLHWLGSGLALAGIIFVIIRMRTYWLDLDFSRVTLLAWISISIFAIVYGFANTLLASAWRDLLAYLGESLPRSEAIRIYGISQLAKYLPGNIFHLAGRQALGMAAGVPGSLLAKSTLWELGLIATTAMLFGVLTLPSFTLYISAAQSIPIFIGVAWLFSRILRKLTSQHTASAFIYQATFLGISAGVFTALVAVISKTEVISFEFWPTIGGAYTLAWLAGLVTPGAPAGVGVREMILLLLLKGTVQEGDLLMAILLGRVVTVTGDFLFFAAASLLRSEATNTEKDNV